MTLGLLIRNVEKEDKVENLGLLKAAIEQDGEAKL